MATVFNMRNPYAGSGQALAGLLGTLGKAIQRKQLIDSLPEDDPRRTLIRGLPIQMAQQKVAGSLRDPLEEALIQSRTFYNRQAGLGKRATNQFAVSKELRARQNQMVSLNEAFQKGQLTPQAYQYYRQQIAAGQPNAKPLAAQRVSPGQEYINAGYNPKIAAQMERDRKAVQAGTLPRAQNPKDALTQMNSLSEVRKNLVESYGPFAKPEDYSDADRETLGKIDAAMKTLQNRFGAELSGAGTAAGGAGGDAAATTTFRPYQGTAVTPKNVGAFINKVRVKGSKGDDVDARSRDIKAKMRQIWRFAKTPEQKAQFISKYGRYLEQQ